MGCLIPKPPPNDSTQASRYQADQSTVIFPTTEEPNTRGYVGDSNSQSSPSPPRPPLPSRPLPKPTRHVDQSCVQLHTPIYVAKEVYRNANADELSFDKHDEMELIEEVNAHELRVNHLRSGLSGLVPKDSVCIDVDTPLRLAVQDLGVINRCLMHYNVAGAYLIRRSGNNPKAFVLSISQFNEQYNSLTWHYLIRLNPSNNCFYFSQEGTLQNIFFSSFQELTADERVRALIPLTEIVPYSIKFEGEVWRIPFDELTIGEKIGEGQFGEVFRAKWHRDPHNIEVAVKKLHICEVTSTVEREIEAMKTLTNLFIVSLYGISQTPETKEILIVTELMENGDLKSWLKDLPSLPNHATLGRFAKDIATGMVFLESRNYVHRDLACRNILLGPSGHRVKIADFGLSTILDSADAARRLETRAQKLPARSSAPESLADQAVYSIKSDVWAYGILLIELWLKGGDPYENEHPAWIQAAVKAGHVHEKPADCPQAFYEAIICRCLKFEPNDRPSFSALRQLLEKWQYS